MSKTVSFKEAARRVLEQADEPLSAKEITERALARGLLKTEGRTPDATMSAQLYVDIRRNHQSGFRKVGKGLFAVEQTKKIRDSPAVILDEQNQRVRKELKERLHAIDPFQFESLVGDLLQKIGYEGVTVTRRSGDNGVDIKATLTAGGVTHVKTVVQVKRYKEDNRVSGRVVRELRGAAEVDQRGLIITTSDFQKSARQEAEAANKMPVSLVNGLELVDLLVRYGVGVKKQQITLLSVDPEYFENREQGIEKESDAQKSRSLWPLPGGTEQYVEALDRILQTVADGVTDRNALIDWLIEHYDNVESRTTSLGYINVPKNMGLLDYRDGALALTDAGAEYLKTKDLELLYGIISANIMAFDDIVEFIATSGVPQNESSILDFVNDNFDVTWTTYAQVNFRLLWLMNLGKIRRGEDGYALATRDGAP